MSDRMRGARLGSPGVDGPMTAPIGVAPPPDRAALPDIRIQILHVPDCPLVEHVRSEVQLALATVGAHGVIEELEGQYPSPTLLIDGFDVTGGHAGADPSCRLDLPTQDQILTALRVALGVEE